ncbi:MAG: membrane protein insertion efficiency factor YidD [bacterium]
MKITLLTILLYLSFTNIAIADRMNSPDAGEKNYSTKNSSSSLIFSKKQQTTANRQQTFSTKNLSIPSIAFSQTIRFYQKFISGRTGKQCPMYPSCSNYSYQSFQRYDFLKGYMMTCDRLMRCGHEGHLYQKILLNKKEYYFNPVL